jgi:hypothetical protein
MSAARENLGREGMGAMLQKITSFEANVTAKRIHQSEVTVPLDKAELEALATWINDRLTRISSS